MRKRTMPIATVALVLAACSPGREPLAFDLARPIQPPPAPFSVPGEAVDDGVVVCPSGGWLDVRLEDTSGNEIDIADWFAIFDAAIETDSVAEVIEALNFECDDGSGTITITERVRFDFGVIDAGTLGSGRFENGTWTLEGTGDSEDLTGSGEVFTDDEGQIHTVGEVDV